MDEITVTMGRSELPPHINALTKHCEKIALSITGRSSDQRRIPLYQSADGYIAWQLLNAIVHQCRVPENGVFCEWGSGIGHVTLMASSLGLKATGIEIHSELVDIAKGISKKLDISAEFKSASMYPIKNTIPPMDYHSVDLFFVYPWPREVDRTIELFQQVAKPGTILACYKGGLQFHVFKQ